jgi:ADP-ribosylation factor-binding protein GGA
LTDRLLLINDLINNVIERYQSFKKGDFTAKLVIDPSIDPSKGGADAVPTAKITDLISFDDEEAASAADAAKAPTASSVLDDFASLSFGPPASASNGNSNTSSLPLDLFGPAQQQSSTDTGVMAGAPLGQWGALQLPMNVAPTPSQQPPSNGTSTPTGPMVPQPSRPAQATPQKPADPFADLSKW